MNVVFIGHVDAGKSTTGGQILYLTVRHTPSAAFLGETEGMLAGVVIQNIDANAKRQIASGRGRSFRQSQLLHDASNAREREGGILDFENPVDIGQLLCRAM